MRARLQRIYAPNVRKRNRVLAVAQNERRDREESRRVQVRKRAKRREQQFECARRLLLV